MRTLIIEDDPWLAVILKRELGSHYRVDIQETGKSGLYAAETNQYDVIAVDVGLPDVSGLEVCRQLRQNGMTCPIIVLTGNRRPEDAVIALDSGADDYLCKPFNFAELRARFSALLRRNSDRNLGPVLIYEDLEVDTVSRTVRRCGDCIRLRRKEHDLLELLMRRQGEIIDCQTMLEHVWDENANNFTNAVTVHIKHLRDKIDKPYNLRLIHTVYGFGYRFGKEVVRV